MNELSVFLQKSRDLHQLCLEDQNLIKDIKSAKEILIDTALNDKPILICGNGGSASDADHFAAELVGRYLKNRKALFALALSNCGATMTALSNDFGYESVFERQVEAYGQEGGCVVGISTSGKSPNVIKAFKAARQKKMKTIAFLGEFQDSIKPFCDVCICVPSNMTPLIQQMHSVIYHYLCGAIEEAIHS